jgi:hypothetical protein
LESHLAGLYPCTIKGLGGHCLAEGVGVEPNPR